MTTDADLFTVGVEEEFLVIDPATRRLAPQADRVRARVDKTVGDQVDLELQSSQIEIGTTVCRTLDDVRRELARLRRQVAAAASEAGMVIAAAGTHPFSDWRESSVTPKEAYQILKRDYQQLVREQIVCGCHIHVALKDREEAKIGRAHV
jgi:carboxylate-amine ligase